MEDILTDPLTRSADMYEHSNKCMTTVSSGTPGELLISHSLQTSAQLPWTPGMNTLYYKTP